MKLALVLFAAMLLPLPALAQDTPPIDITPGPAEQPTETAEIIVIGTGTMLALANIGMVATAEPSYAFAGIGIGLGVTAFALTAVENPAHETGLFAAGSFAVATGLIALRYRHVLDRGERQARIAPAWSDGAPAVVLVIDF